MSLYDVDNSLVVQSVSVRVAFEESVVPSRLAFDFDGCLCDIQHYRQDDVHDCVRRVERFNQPAPPPLLIPGTTTVPPPPSSSTNT